MYAAFGGIGVRPGITFDTEDAKRKTYVSLLVWVFDRAFGPKSSDIDLRSFFAYLRRKYLWHQP